MSKEEIRKAYEILALECGSFWTTLPEVNQSEFLTAMQTYAEQQSVEKDKEIDELKNIITTLETDAGMAEFRYQEGMKMKAEYESKVVDAEGFAEWAEDNYIRIDTHTWGTLDTPIYTTSQLLKIWKDETGK